MLQISVKKNKAERSTYLSPDEKAFVVSEEAIDGAQGYTIVTALIAAELQSVVESV